MKTQQKIEEMAEKRFPTINLPPDKSFYEHNLMQHGFIKGYQVAQEEMKQIAIDYAKFCIHCERDGLPLLEFDGFINLPQKP